MACSAAGSGTDSTQSSSNGGTGFGATSNGSGGTGVGAGTSFGGVASGAAPNGTEDGGCAETVQQAEKRTGGRADIIFAIDNSGSMTEEAIAVQNNMNTFSGLISMAGIDAHVVVISSGPPGGQAAPCTNFLDPACWISLASSAWGSSNGVCIEPPLGLAGACPAGNETNLPNYFHEMTEVGSHNALALIQQTFGNWQSVLRPDAAKTFVVVTDDENSPPPTGDEFRAWVDGQPVFQGAVWRFSGVFCVTGAGGNCAGAGNTYAQLVTQTGGISGDMGQFASGMVDSAFATVFGTLADAVVQDAVPVDCEWAIPTPDNGQEINPNQVNVRYTNGGGQVQDIYGVQDAAHCTNEYGGWYYDDNINPSRVIACPTTCQVLQSDLMATVSVVFGCDRQYAPVQ